MFCFVLFFLITLNTEWLIYCVGRFISLATLWDMLTAATLLGSVMPIILPPLQESRVSRMTRTTHTFFPPMKHLQRQHHKLDKLPGIAGFIQKLRHLSGFSTPRLSTDDDTGIFSHGLHDDLLLCQNGQL